MRILQLYIIVGLAVTVTNDLILAAIGAPYGSKWSRPLGALLNFVAWPLNLAMWVYRVVKPVPSFQVRRDDD